MQKALTTAATRPDSSGVARRAALDNCATSSGSASMNVVYLHPWILCSLRYAACNHSSTVSGTVSSSVAPAPPQQMLRCHRPQLLHSQPQVSSKPLVIWFTASARGLHRPKAIHGCHAPPPTQEQVRFVQQVVHPDVSNGELRGQNSFLEQWRRYTAFFGSLALHPQSFSMLPGNVGHAVCQTQLTLSLLLESSAFQHVFPHLLQPQHSTLLQRLSNQQLHVPMTLQLQFDALGRVCSYDASMNFVQALRPLLASYEDVAAVLHDALISPCGHIGRDVQRVRDVRLQVSFMLSPS